MRRQLNGQVTSPFGKSIEQLEREAIEEADIAAQRAENARKPRTFVDEGITREQILRQIRGDQ